MTPLRNLDDLFIHTLCRIYDAEKRLTTALPKMAKAADDPELRQAFENHQKQTEVHVDRLEQMFAMFDRSPKADTDDGLKGIIKSGEEVIGLKAGGSVKDAALIAAAQEAEHYEIAAYGTLRTWAEVLNKRDAVQLLELTLEDEKNADQRLSAIAQTLNLQAAAAEA
jgi:ferritin-like metal-binding protein YciE